MKLTEIEKKQLESQERDWYLKSDQDKTWFVHRTGKYTMDEISEKLYGSKQPEYVNPESIKQREAKYLWKDGRYRYLPEV